MNKHNKIQIFYHAGTFGNLLRWMLDRFSPLCKFKDQDDPWDSDNGVHGEWDYQERFKRAHQVAIPYANAKIDPDADKIVISFRLDDLLFIERLNWYRVPGHKIANRGYQGFVKNFDQATLDRLSVSKDCDSEMVAKELFKMQLHDEFNHLLWNKIIGAMEDKNNHQFPIYCLWDEKSLAKELAIISEKYNLQLQLNKSIISNITANIGQHYVVKTKDRAKDVLNAITNKKELDCGNLDIFEQSFIEVILEKQNDKLMFAYGTNWFNNTKQIIEYMDTYPKYLKESNVRLPWYSGSKNPFYLTGRIDRPK